MEILDLIAKVSWQTNTQELTALNKELKAQDKALDELTKRGQKLEQQLAKTNDPAKQAKYAQELAKTRSAMQGITDVQKKQAEATKTLVDRQKELLQAINKTTDPKQYKAMLNELAGIEKAMRGLNQQAKDLPSKLSGLSSSLGGIGSSIMGGLGLSVGQFGLEGIVGGIKSFVESANQEFIDAENTTLRFKNTLQGLGKEQYFDELTAEADMLAQQIGYLDNDDIVSAQEKLLTYGKVTKGEMSQLLPIIIDLAARMGTDVPSATETMINIMEGRGGSALRQLGLNIKDANSTTERLGVVFEELGPKIAGSAETVKNSSDGMKRTLDQQVANLEESIGESTIGLRNYFLEAYAGFLGLIKKISQSEEDERKETTKNYYNDRLNEAKAMSDKELNFEKTLMQTKIDDIKVAQAQIFELEKQNAQTGFKYIGALREAENEKEIKAKRDFIARREADVQAVLKETQNRQSKDQEDAAVRALRLSEDNAEKDKELQKKREEDGKAASARKKQQQEAERKAMEQLAQQVEADRVKLAEFTLTEDERELMNLERKYSDMLAMAKGNAALELQIRENFANAVVQVERKRVGQMEALNAKEVIVVKDTTKEYSEGLAARGLATAKAMQQDVLNQAEKKKADDERKQKEFEDLAQSVTMAAGVAQQFIGIEQERVDRLIGLQEERLSAAREDSSASLLIEQNRYDELIAQRRKYEQQQRAIDAVVIVANQAVAISSAIRSIITEGAKLGPVGIAAQVVAIVAGLGASLAAVKSATADIPAFREGGYTGDGDPGSESTAVGKRPYTYHKKEFVMNEELTSKHRDLFEGMHRKDLVVKKIDDGQYYITKSGIDTDKMVDNHYTIKNSSANDAMLYELGSIKALLERREVTVTNNFDADGFGTSIATQLGRVELKKMLR
jgi:myosin heavy subunit